MISDPIGRICIGRGDRSTDRTWQYDLFDTNGAPIDSATLPVNSRIVGFGSGVCLPSTDLIFVERHRLDTAVQ